MSYCMNQKKSETNQILIAIGLFCAPIFFINVLLPAHPKTSGDVAINDFLDIQLLGLVGFWSSLFPFCSKVTANYIAIFGPMLSIFSTYKTLTTELDPSQLIYLQKITFRRYLTLLVAASLILALLIWAFYFDSEDLGTSNGKYGNLFGLNVVFFSIHCAVLSCFFFFGYPILIRRFFYCVPRLLITRWRINRKKT